MPNIFIPREIREDETRVAAVPETVQRLTRDGFSVSVQRGAGIRSMIADEALDHAGARLSEDPASAYAAMDLVAKLHPPTLEEADWRSGLASRRQPARIARLALREQGAV